MSPKGRFILGIAAAISFAVFLLHILIVLIGPAAYRYFGAPSLADEVERGALLRPTLMTLAIALVFAVWGLYALSGAFLIRRLPLLRTALLAIGTVFVARGILVVPEALSLAEGTLKYPQAVAFSAISLLAGLCYLAGVVRAWTLLRPPARGPA